ncbi:TonB-dependent receptor [Ancylomarina sp. 16SWW S1-10-2]|uniref:TonB-dependent receptor domain-containing protein n=1 Tax=Ancylomarina sp. 16SWW S1-10-2 TaxID=2499681 RepID=UPI0012AE515E|nr:TonB-dependent receptor [Ancylomarina sp. 16SWW S1-10-2]MRT92881.1 TonB-dependent receptor [Ancylomarina sp. 16SWW S1-10-2]
MKRTLLLLVFTMLICVSQAISLVPNSAGALNGTIKGIVIDNDLKTPVEYATVSVFHMSDSSLINGTITNAQGEFELKHLKPSKYYIEISFIGYNKKTIRNIPINNDHKHADLKNIYINQASEALNEVTVNAERLPVQYEIDKKVIPVSRQLTTASGNAVDVLESVPSIDVDIEGNVSLRGSSSFTVLVDGRPSILDAADILTQMPASVIDNIEIITNPSAKYDPEGSSGIVNIITKKGKLKGTSGVVNLNLGNYDNYGADFLVNVRKNKFNFHVGMDYNNRNFSGDRESENRTTSGDKTTYVFSEGNSDRQRLGYGFRTGFDYEIDDNNIITLGLRYGGREMESSSKSDYTDYFQIDGQDPSTPEEYISTDVSNRDMEFYNANFSYLRKFEGKGHQLLTQVNYSYRDGDEKSKTERKQDASIVDGKKSTEKGPSSHIDIRTDYTLPLGGKSKFEAGYQSKLRQSEDITTQSDYSLVDIDYIPQPEYGHEVDYKKNVHGAYALYADQSGKFGYQVGLRTEYTDREIKFKGGNENFTINRWDFFPTIHTQVNLKEGNQVMASYTRRIQRPRGSSLEPFITWSDAYNVRKGNPNLKPEYIDSYELSYQKRIGEQSFSFETYYRVTQNVMEGIRSVYQENVMLSTTENVGTDYSLGLETMFNLSLAKWFKNDLIGNVYRYKEEGDYTTYDSDNVPTTQDFSTKSFNWSLRNNSTIMFNKTTRFQVNVRYNSASKKAQGERKAFITANLGLKKEFMQRKLSATLQLRNILNTAKYENISKGNGFYNNSKFDMQWPSIKLNLSYKINNYKKKRGPQEENVDMEEFEMQ